MLIFVDTPEALGFDEAFREQFDALLQELSSASADGKTQEFHIFRRTRDFQKLPDSVRLIKTSRFFGHLSNLYSIIFHHLGGEARVTAVKDGGTDVHIRSCIRTLFLKSEQVRADLWITPMFNKELEKATTNLAPETAAYEARTLIRELRERIFDPKIGTIQLDLSLDDPRSLGTRKLFASKALRDPIFWFERIGRKQFLCTGVQVCANLRSHPSVS